MKKAPFFRLFLVVTGIVMLCFLPTREFLKVTFFIAIPFIFILRFMGKQVQTSFLWFLSGFVLIALLGLYGYSLVQLPERIEIRAIIRDGSTQLANGQYDRALQTYQGLELLGQQEKAEEKIREVQKEEAAHKQLIEAQSLLAQGQKEKARAVLETLPSQTRAAVEGNKLLRSMNSADG